MSILAGRDRMCAVLEPLLGFELARERANNIAQVLALAAHDPEQIALCMLRGTGLSDLSSIASRVSSAWDLALCEVELRTPREAQRAAS